MGLKLLRPGLHRRLLELRPHFRLQPSQAVLLPVDELSRFGEHRMDGLNLAPHLLADEAVIGMALGHGAELDHMQRFAQVHLHVPANLPGGHGRLFPKLCPRWNNPVGATTCHAIFRRLIPTTNQKSRETLHISIAVPKGESDVALFDGRSRNLNPG